MHAYLTLSHIFAHLPLHKGAYACMQEEGITRWPPGISYQLVAVRAQSKGSVKLEAADMTQRPAIDLAYLSDKAGPRPLPAYLSKRLMCCGRNTLHECVVSG